MTRESLRLTVHSSLQPHPSLVGLQESLRADRLPPRIHYASWRQAAAWRALHQRYAPFHQASDGAALYEQGSAAAADQLRGTHVSVLSLGCGTGHKDRLVLSRFPAETARYVPVDAGLDLVLTAALMGVELLGPDRVHPWLLDLATAEDWRSEVDSLPGAADPRLVLAYGLLPTFEPECLGPLLSRLLRPADLLLLSANLSPPGGDAGNRVLQLYDNRETRSWLAMALEDLGLDPQGGRWEFELQEGKAPTDPSCVRAWFRPHRSIRPTLEGINEVTLGAGTTLQVFASYRYSHAATVAFAAQHALEIEDSWISAAGEEGVFLCRRRG